MISPAFTVVIPTLNRSDVLRASILTCLAQDEPAMQVLISDNCSTDDTAQVVKSYHDTRIRYVKPHRQLGMPEHWEFALSHVAQGFVSVLGDDDGLLPGAVRRARSILQSTKAEALAWRKAEYHWPDHILPTARNWLQIPVSGREQLLSSAAVVREVLSFKRTYTDLPCIYNSFVSTDVLDRIRRRSKGRLLPCITPDIYSGIAIAHLIDRYAFTGVPLSVNAASRHSNGTITSLRGTNDRDAIRHFASSAERMHPSLTRCSSVPVLIADAAFAVQERLEGANPRSQVDLKAMLELALHYAQYRSEHVYRETLVALDEIAKRHGLEAYWAAIRSAAKYKGTPDLQAYGWNTAGDSLVLNGATLGLRDVADAANCVSAVLCSSTAACSSEGGIDDRVASCLPVNLEPCMRWTWIKVISDALRDRPPAPPRGVRRIWRALRRRAFSWRRKPNGPTPA